MTRSLKIAGALIALLALSACIAGSAESAHAASGGVLSQVLLGLWHGIIAPVALIIEVVDRFAPNVLPWHARLYETRAANVFYDLGFYFGLAGGPGLVLGGWSRRRV